MKKTVLIFTLAALSVLPVFAAGSTEKEGVTFVTTTSLVDDAVRRVAGEGIDVYSLIAKGQDPHSYEPTPRDMARVEKADIVFVNGFDLEENLLNVLQTVHTGRIVEVSSSVNSIHGDEGNGHDADADDDHDDHHQDAGEDHDDHHHDADEDHDDHHHDGDEDHDDHHHDGDDPHTWMSPLNVMAWVDVIEEALIQALPEQADTFRVNAESYRNELSELDSWIRAELEVIPMEKRVLVTDHNVFGYFARDYGFEVIGTIIPGFSSTSEPSAGDISRLLDLLESEEVNALFVGESAGEGTRKLAETLSSEARHSIGVYGVLTGSLRAEGDEADDYIGFMKFNVKQIISGLRG